MLLVNEIYTAISGESRFAGWPCTLVRLTGCHLRCSWCDSEHSFSGGNSMSVSEVLSQVDENSLPMVLLTGGEPLLQKESIQLMQALLDTGTRVLLETSGTLMGPRAVTLDQVPAGVNRVVDLKAPGSGISSEIIDWQGLAALGPDDEIKVVCADREDYLWARNLVLEGGHWPDHLRVSFSPVQDSLPARNLAEWILEDRLNVCFQIQLHKAVWPEIDRGV